MTALTRLAALYRRLACRFANVGPGIAALLFVALWAFYELLRAWTTRGG